jgi:hypothetical protein
MVVIFPLTAPEAQAVIHLINAFEEDGNATLDFDGFPGQKNGYVLWELGVNHEITDPLGYSIPPDYTLEIPEMNYDPMNPMSNRILIGTGLDIIVDGTLVTRNDFNPATRNGFLSSGLGWGGIYINSGGSATLIDVHVEGSANGVIFNPGSTMDSAITASTFLNNGLQHLNMDGAGGNTNINQGPGDNVIFGPASAWGVQVSNQMLNISGDVFFQGFGSGFAALHIDNSTVSVNPASFDNNLQTGNSIFIEGENSNDTVIQLSSFNNGAPDSHYIRVDGASPLIDNCTFSLGGGERSVVANDLDYPAHPVLLNPNPPGTTFNNDTLNATGASSVTLKWYMDVYVSDPDANPILGKPVTVVDRLDNPSVPPMILTDGTGWARWFMITELIQYAGSRDNFNPFNVSAENNSMTGYAFPEPTMSLSQQVPVIVPFNPVPNSLPKVIYIETPSGVQTGDVSIDYILEDINEGENGSLMIEVYWSLTGIPGDWNPATIASGSDPIVSLFNNTLYTYIWDSTADLPDWYNTTVFLQIIPYDTFTNGTPVQTGMFTLDNKKPDFLTLPTVTVTDTTALIEWTVDEDAYATVWYGFNITDSSADCTDEVTNPVASTSQSVSLTGLSPGRNYIFIINSTDPEGNKRSSINEPPPNEKFFFETEVHIQLYKGWNMISFLPVTPDPFTGLQPWVGAVLSNILGNVLAVQAYDPLDTADPWKHNVTGKTFGNDLEFIFPHQGLWVLMKNDDELILDQLVPPVDNLEYMLLSGGWNFVGYPSATTRTVDNAMMDEFDNPISYNLVKTYDAFTDTWLTWDGNSGSLANMEMGRGYWVSVDSDVNWKVVYV